MAKILGYSSFADLTLAGNRVASSTQEVINFLNNLTIALKPKVTQELQHLRTLKTKYQEEGDLNINAWDKSYYCKLLKSQFYDMGSNYMPHYLSLSDCLFGLNNILSNVFNINFKEVSMDKVFYLLY